MAHWWEHYPWRMVQGNLREVDMDGMDARAYAQEMAEFGATVVNLNAAGILASYETKLDFQEKSAYLTGDSLLDMVNACHERGMKVIARCDFTKVSERIYNAHPDWAYRHPDGTPLIYNGTVQVCFNSEYQKTAKIEILKELFSEIPFDGVFFNMGGAIVTDYDGNIHPPCHCSNCVAAYQQAFGPEATLPEKLDAKDPKVMRYIGFSNRIAGANTKAMVAAIRAINPELCIMGTDVVRSESNNDVDRVQWQLSASMNSRLGAGLQEYHTVDNASTDFAGFQFRHVSVSPALAKLRQWQNLANSGCLSFFVMGTLSNHKVTSSYEPTKEIFAFHKAHEDVYTHLCGASSVLLLHERNWHMASEEEKGWAEALTASHIPFAEATASDIKSVEQLAGLQAVIVPAIKNLPESLAQILDAFAEQGGTVIGVADAGMISKGKPMPAPASKCFGVERYTGRVANAMTVMYQVEESEKDLFPHLAESPYIGVGNMFLKVQPAQGTKQYLGQIGEHPTGPPELVYFDTNARTGEAGLYVCHYGKGKGIYIPWTPGQVYMQMGMEQTLCYMQDVLLGFAGLTDQAPGATSMLEVDVAAVRGSDQSDGLLVSLVNLTGCWGSNKYFAPIPLQDVTVTVPKAQLAAAGLTTGNGSAAEISAAGISVVCLNGGRIETMEMAETAALENTKEGLILRLDMMREYEGILIRKNS